MQTGTLSLNDHSRPDSVNNSILCTHVARIGVLSGNGRAQSNSNTGSFNTRPVLQPTHKVMQASSQPGGQMLQACIPSSSRFISRSNNLPATSNSVESSEQPNKIAGLPNISLAPGQSAVFSDFKQFLDSYPPN